MHAHHAPIQFTSLKQTVCFRWKFQSLAAILSFRGLASQSNLNMAIFYFGNSGHLTAKCTANCTTGSSAQWCSVTSGVSSRLNVIEFFDPLVCVRLGDTKIEDLSCPMFDDVHIDWYLFCIYCIKFCFQCACTDAEQMVEHHRMIEKVDFDFVPPRPTKKAVQSKMKDTKVASTDKKSSGRIIRVP